MPKHYSLEIRQILEQAYQDLKNNENSEQDPYDSRSRSKYDEVSRTTGLNSKQITAWMFVRRQSEKKKDENPEIGEQYAQGTKQRKYKWIPKEKRDWLEKEFQKLEIALGCDGINRLVPVDNKLIENWSTQIDHPLIQVKRWFYVRRIKKRREQGQSFTNFENSIQSLASHASSSQESGEFPADLSDVMINFGANELDDVGIDLAEGSTGVMRSVPSKNHAPTSQVRHLAVPKVGLSDPVKTLDQEDYLNFLRVSRLRYPITRENVASLLKVAAHFRLKLLKEKCETFLRESTELEMPSSEKEKLRQEHCLDL